MTDIGGVTGAYPIDIDGDGITRPRRPRTAATTCCAGSAVAGSSARTSPGHSTAGEAGRRRSARPGRRDAALPTLAFGNYLRARQATTRDRTAATTALRPPRGRRVRAAVSCRPAGARCRCCSATGTARAGGTSGSATTATTTNATAGAAVAYRRRASRRASTRRRTAGPVQIWGMGIASQDLTGDGYPEVYLTSQGDNRLQTLADGPAPADVRRHRPASAA